MAPQRRQRGITAWIAAIAVGALAAIGLGLWIFWPHGDEAPAAVGTAAPAPVAPAAGTDADGFTTIANTTIRFADVASGRAVLGAAGDWTARTSPWQRAVLMGRTAAPDVDTFRAFQAASVQPWPPEARARWRRALEA